MTGPQRAIASQQREPRPRGTPGGEPEPVRVWLLGGFRVTVGPRSIGEEKWRLKKAASLLKLLALAPGHRLHREQAMELLWPDLDPEAALNNLHHALHVARRALEPSAPAGSAASRYLHLRDEWLALCPEGALWVDVEAFEEAATTARHALEPVAYQVAIDLYPGELSPQERYEAWVEERRAELRGVYLSLLVELAGLYEERGDLGEAVETLAKVAAEESTYEGAHVGLMRLYALSGRRREALGQYDRLQEALFREFGEEPEETARSLQQEIWAGTFPPADSPVLEGSAPQKPVGAGKHTLPLARTSFVGRERETLEVKRLLAMTQLLTLTGAGGSGKTRLALKVARDLAGAYPDGAWLVELASLSEPELVPQAVAAALGVREQPGRPLLETLKDVFPSKKMLLILDNCEHLIEAVVDLVDALLDSCPDLQVLATSRETLNAACEVNWVVPPLSVPDPWHPSKAEELGNYESVRLFIERTRQRVPFFVLTLQNGQAVAQICRRLDGIPLAIELAAARMGVLAVEQLAKRLEDSLKLLSGGNQTAEPRHQTLRATLDWSYELLGEAEQALFGRLAVFAGGWTLETAEDVCPGEGIEQDEVLDLLSELVNKSLVVAEASPGEEGVVRCRMLEPVRQYAQERLQESKIAEWVRDRHATFFFDLAQKAEPELRRAQQEAWAEQLTREYENLRAALSWVIASGQTELALQLAKALGPFWYLRGFLREGQRWLRAALANKDVVTPSIRAKGLSTSAFIAFHQGDYERTIALCEEVLALPREMVDPADVAATLTNLGLMALVQNDYERSEALFEEATALWRQTGDKVGIVRTLYLLGLLAAFRGAHAKARALHEESLPVAWEVGDKVGIAWSLAQGAFAALSRGDYEQVKALCTEGIELTRQTGYSSHSTVFMLRVLAALASTQGQPLRSARLWGMAEISGESIGVAITPIEQQYYRPYIAAARAQLDEATWEAAWAKVKAMTQEEAIEYALSEKEPTLPPEPEEAPTTNEPIANLTHREQEIALLVGRGLTNRRIASELSISERTVENHVRKILKRLGFSSRARIAAWVAQR